jgi:hypothetical protein
MISYIFAKKSLMCFKLCVEILIQHLGSGSIASEEVLPFCCLGGVDSFF